MKPRFAPAGLKKVKAWEYAVRFAFGGFVALGTALIGRAYGPGIGGLFLGFPAILPASLTLVKQHEGRVKAIDDARGAVLGGAGMIAFGLLVWGAARHWPAGVILATALAAWGTVSVGLWSWVFGRARP